MKVDLRLTTSLIDPETGEVHRVAIFVDGNAIIDPEEADGPKSLAGVKLGPLLEVGWQALDEAYSWQLVAMPHLVEPESDEPQGCSG